MSECNIDKLDRALDDMQIKVDNLEIDLDQIISTNRTNDFDELSSCTNSYRSLSQPTSDQRFTIIEYAQKVNQAILVDLEELKTENMTIQQQKEEYREKLKHAQSLVEEQKSRLDLIDQENVRAREYVNQTVQQVNDQFKVEQQDFQHLSYSDIDLDEAKQKLRLSDKIINALTNDLQSCLLKCELQANQLNEEQKLNENLKNQALEHSVQINSLELQLTDLRENNEYLQNCNSRMSILEEALEQKIKEIFNLKQDIENLRYFEKQQINRSSDENNLEKEIIELRKKLNNEIKEREQMRLLMQIDLKNLSWKFQEAQYRIENLKGNIEHAKSSWTKIMRDECDADETDLKEICNNSEKFIEEITHIDLNHDDEEDILKDDFDVNGNDNTSPFRTMQYGITYRSN